MAQKNKNLRIAKIAKNDEFYTQLTDIEKELRHYKHHFKDKIVFCNCDDPTWSEFWRYFHLNFAELGLKKLISTHFDFNEPTYKLEYEGGNDWDIEVGVKTILMQNGDFRSDECIELLKESDIVVTNPPFSLFREYISQLMEYEKKFIIIGSKNAITYKEIFPLIKNNLMWIGAKPMSGSLWFTTPNDYRNKNDKLENGIKLTPIACCWYTNLDISKRHENLILWKEYNPVEYPKFDNYDAINVDKTTEIPCDYAGIMGVPITFLDKYNPEQFEIINGIGRYACIEDTYTNPIGTYGTDVDGKHNYFRILIRKKASE